MPGMTDQALDIDLVAPEGGVCFGTAACIGLVEFGGRINRSHAAPTAAGDRLDHDGATGPEPGQKGVRLIERDGGLTARDHRDTAAFRQCARQDLVAEGLQGLDARTDERDAGLLALSSQLRVFAQKSVAGMQRIAAGDLRGRDHRGDVEIGASAGSWQRASLVGLAHVQRGGVVLRMNGDGGQSGFGRGARDPDGDFAAIGDQHFLKAHDSVPVDRFVYTTNRIAQGIACVPLRAREAVFWLSGVQIACSNFAGKRSVGLVPSKVFRECHGQVQSYRIHRSGRDG